MTIRRSERCPSVGPSRRRTVDHESPQGREPRDLAPSELQTVATLAV
jgi:hypothetical protein